MSKILEPHKWGVVLFRYLLMLVTIVRYFQEEEGRDWSQRKH